MPGEVFDSVAAARECRSTSHLSLTWRESPVMNCVLGENGQTPLYQRCNPVALVALEPPVLVQGPPTQLAFLLLDSHPSCTWPEPGSAVCTES